MSGTEETRAAIEAVARASYSRLVAYLAIRSRDIAAAEDALSEAFAAALRTWPETGAPDRPEAWLLTAARRVLGHGERHARVRATAAPMLELASEEAASALETSAEIPDERLKLLLACARPEIAPADRTPLMLQVVLGLDAARIAAAFLTSPAAMGQRLARAKARIREAGVAFEAPDADALPARMDDVLAAVYAAYGAGWAAVPGAEDGARGLAEEALFLARVIAELAPQAAEAKGLLALLLYCEARLPARRGAGGAFIPLHRQDARLWRRDMIIAAENLLTEAARRGEFGRFQTEAAIQSVHVQRGATGETNWEALAQLYDLLCARHPTLGAEVSRAVAHAEAGRAAASLAILDLLPSEAMVGYQPWWAARARVMRLLGRDMEARAALLRAAGLSEDPAVRAFLMAEAGD